MQIACNGNATEVLPLKWLGILSINYTPPLKYRVAESTISVAIDGWFPRFEQGFELV